MNKILITILLALVAMTGQAKEKNDSLYLYGTVADGFTKAAVEKAFVTLMREDSTVVDTMRVYMWHSWSSGVGRSAGSSRYYFRVSRQPANYINGGARELRDGLPALRHETGEPSAT